MVQADYLVVLIAIAVFFIVFTVGFLIGYSLRLLRLINTEHKIYKADKVVETLDIPEDASEGAVVDSSPKHIKVKRDERVRKGEDPIPEESQIVNTKTPEQKKIEVDAATEKKLDKWMPDVKHE